MLLFFVFFFSLHVRIDMFHLAECIVVKQEQEVEEVKEKGREEEEEEEEERTTTGRASM